MCVCASIWGKPPPQHHHYHYIDHLPSSPAHAKEYIVLSRPVPSLPLFFVRFLCLLRAIEAIENCICRLICTDCSVPVSFTRTLCVPHFRAKEVASPVPTLWLLCVLIHGDFSHFPLAFVCVPFHWACTQLQLPQTLSYVHIHIPKTNPSVARLLPFQIGHHAPGDSVQARAGPLRTGTDAQKGLLQGSSRGGSFGHARATRR